MTIPPLSDEQQAVVDCTSRLTVVRACPGSGKTRVFVDALKKRLEGGKFGKGGVAALSFTNVAQEEVTKRLGGQLPGPHFIGTLDTFMYRFVVRPFAHLVGATTNGVQLVPSPLDSYLESPKVWLTDNARDAISVFEAQAIRGTETEPEFVYYNKVRRKTDPVPANVNAQVLYTKRRQWAERGRITHSDCQFLASAILADPVHGQNVADIIARRFPVILVDEFQDTGWFLGRALLRILCHSDVSALVVGDPDQAIYEFNGADPELFAKAERLEGAQLLRLTETRRCPKRVAAVASALSASTAEVSPLETAEEGRAILLIHDLADPLLTEPIVTKLAEIHSPGESAVILARKRPVVAKLSGESQDGNNAAGKVVRRLDRAAFHLSQGDSGVAARDVASVFGGLLWQDYAPTSSLLREKSVPTRDWRRAIFEILQTAANVVEGETWGDWSGRCKEALRLAAESIGHPIEGRKLGGNFKRFDGCDEPRGGPHPIAFPMSEGTAPDFHHLVRTVHQAKGAEFDTVAFFVPKPNAQRAKCPSLEWWPQGTEMEERRIAFVAASRAKRSFVLCIHRDTYQSFQRVRQSFVELFDETVDVIGLG